MKREGGKREGNLSGSKLKLELKIEWDQEFNLRFKYFYPGKQTKFGCLLPLGIFTSTFNGIMHLFFTFLTYLVASLVTSERCKISAKAEHFQHMLNEYLHALNEKDPNH